MKILHMADLHIGRSIQEQSLIDDQEYILKKVVELIKKEKIDLVLISGDVYDKTIPSTESVDLLDWFLNTLIKDVKVKVLIIAGNHDSKERLGFGNKIFENDGLFIASKYEGQLKKIELEDEYGKLNVYMLPFIKPIDVKKYFEEDIKSYDDAVNKVIGKEKINESERNIIMVHQFVTAGSITPDRTESETISLGGIDNVDVSNFDKFDYVAIGHVHRPQQIGRKTARYAGTMLKYSFSEINHNKTFAILDYKEKNNLQIEFKEIKPIRDMREIKGPIEELLNPKNYEGTNTQDYIRAIITNEEPVYNAIDQIRKIYPNTLKLEIRNSKTNSNIEFNENSLEELKMKSELELFNEFFKMQNGISLDDKESKILESIIKEAKNETN